MAPNARALGKAALQNPIACEPCRNRKRKCDRNLPFCFQCTHEPSKCHYPEQNKRGVPSGFIQRLEARLAETEAALFMVLRESSQSDAPTDDPQLTATFAKSRASHDKLHRVSEWQDLPLQSMDNIRAWYRWKDSERLGLASQEQPASTDEDNVPSGPQRQVEAQDLDNPSQYYIAQDLSRTPSANSAATVPGRAKDLSQSHRDLYF